MGMQVTGISPTLGHLPSDERLAGDASAQDAETDYFKRSRHFRPRGQSPDSYDVVIVNTSGRPQLEIPSVD